TVRAADGQRPPIRREGQGPHRDGLAFGRYLPSRCEAKLAANLARCHFHKQHAPRQENGQTAAVWGVSQGLEDATCAVPPFGIGQSFEAADLVSAGQVPEDNVGCPISPPNSAGKGKGPGIRCNGQRSEGNVVDVLVEAAQAFAPGDVPDSDWVALLMAAPG